MFMYLHKNRKGFTLIELMVVVAIIGILALLGLRLYLLQQQRAKNAIAKANAATVHTIIQGNLADSSYTTAADAVNAIGTMAGVDLDNGDGDNTDQPSGMKNPHLTGINDLVVDSVEGGFATAALFEASIVPATYPVITHAGVVLVSTSNIANKFWVVPLDQNAAPIMDVYVAQK